MDIRKDLQINSMKLIEEAEKQASIFYDYSEEASRLDADYKRQKDKIDYLEAEEDLRIRNEITGKKLTEPAIKTMIRMSRVVIQAKEELITIAKELNDLKAAQRALEHKKSMIDVIARKQGAQQYSGEFYETKYGT